MVKTTESSYRNRLVAENFSSFEKNRGRPGQKPGTDEGRRFSPNSSVYEPQSPEDLRQMKGSMPVSQATVAIRKNDQWNVKRDIPVGTVRNNPFLPEPKQQPPQSPQLKYQKKQWDTSNIPKGSVAARIQKSNSPSSKSGGNKPISPTKNMGGSNGRSKALSNSPSGFSHPNSNEAIRSTSSTPRGFFPKTGSSSSQIKQKTFVKPQEQIASHQQSSQRFNEVKEKVATKRGWEPSKEIPSGTVKGRLSSFYGGQSTLSGKKLKELSTPSSIKSKKIDFKSDEVSTKDEQNLNDDEDQWIIPERKGANIQVFDSDWGEAIPTKSAESDDWDTPAKEWIRSGESQTGVVSVNEVKERAVENESSLPNEITAPVPEEISSQIESDNYEKARKESKPRTTVSSILPPPPKDASAYHKPLSQKSEEGTTFDTKSDSSFSQLFSDKFGSFAAKSEMDSIDNSKTKSGFPVHDDIDRQLVNGSSDAFGFPVSSTSNVVENRTIGEVVSGDEFFDASVLPDDYGQSSKNKESFGATSLRDDYAQPRGEPGFDGSAPANDYVKQSNDAGFGKSTLLIDALQATSDEEDFGSSTVPHDEQDLHASVLPTSYEQPSRNKSASNVDRYQSVTSSTSVDDDVHGSTNEFESGKGDSKKKRKGFLKGLFGRKNKGNGKNKQQNRKDRSYSKTGDATTHLKKSGKKQENLLPLSSVHDPVESKKTSENPSSEDNQTSKEQRGTTITSDKRSDKTLENGFPAQGTISQGSMDPKTSIRGDKSKAVGLVRPILVGDDIFDDLEEDVPVSQKANTEVEDMFLDPELDHLDSNIHSDEESSGDATAPSKPNVQGSSDFDPGRLTKTGNRREDPDPKKINKATTDSSSGPMVSHAYDTQQRGTSGDKKADLISASRRTAPLSRPNASVPRQHSLASSGNPTLGSNFLQMRYKKKGSVFNKASNVNAAARQDQWRGGKHPQDGAVGRHRLSSRNGHDSQYGRENTESRKFSRAAHAYNSITKKNTTEDVEDQRKYLSIPAASTSASDISCASTYDTYQKKLSDSLRKANIVTKRSSDYSLYPNKSLDDSSIESDIRVLRSILRRPRLDRDNARVINASRQIQGFPTYDPESATDPMQRLGMRLLSSAIIPIQTEVRRFLASRQALTRMWALIVIQAHTRRFLERKKFQKAIDSAITIQSVLRGHLARNEVIDKHICAIEIQRYVRGYLATMQVYEDIYKVTLVQSLVRMRIAMDYAAYRMSLIIQLQAIARGFLTRRRNARLKSCATQIQSSWRCFYNRLNYQFDLLDIIIVQSLWRKKLGIRIAERKVAERRNVAATLIQAGWRAYDCRMDFLCYTAARTIQTKWRSHICKMNYIEYQASTAIQSLARMYFCRTDYTYYKCAKKIQSVARMFLCRSQYVEYKCASKIQSTVRMYLCRYDYLEYKAATKLQSAVRMFLCRSGFVEYQCATKIQSIGRMYLCRYDYLEYKAAATLQSAVRMFLCKSDYNKYRGETAATIIQAKWRSYDCSSMYKRYRAARTIQKTWRSYDCQMNFLHFLADILIVQSTIRRFLVQRKVKAIKNDAAIKIQSAWRGLISYIDYHEHLTVRRIQSAWRASVCRRNYKREKAAILIQKSWRGFLFYADYMFELSDIVVAQKQIRVWLAKRVANRRRQEKATERLNRASTIIQTSWRRFWCFSNFVIALDCSIQIQAQMRGYLQRKDYMCKKHAVSVIETAWLNAQAKKLTSQMSVIRDITASSRDLAARESRAAIKLQQVFRGSLCRNALKVYLAAVLIQSHVRGKQARVAVGLYIAIRKVQAVWRGFAPRQSYITYIAARKIQASWRSYFPRQNFITFIAARRIQNSWRCKKANEDVSALKREINSAILIQSAWRGFVSYTDFVFTLSDIVAAQKMARGYLSRKKYSGVIRSNVNTMKARSNAAVAIQMIFRGFQARQNYWYTLGCTMQIQSWWRGRRVYRRILKEANAISILQCFARCCLARQEYMQRRFVFMLIQTAEIERSKKAKGLKMKKQRREDTEQPQRDTRGIQRFSSDADPPQGNQLVVATTRRKERREKMKGEKYSDNVEETLLEDVWTGLIGKTELVDEPFTRHYDDFSKLTGPAIAVASHPTSSIRMIRKVDAVDMDDDFQLEEAFIDAEICHAKERRQYNGKEVHPSPGLSRGVTTSLRKDRRIVKEKKRSHSKGKSNILATINH